MTTHMFGRLVVVLSFVSSLACWQPHGAREARNVAARCRDKERCDEACRGGSAGDCLQLADAYLVSSDSARAREFFTKACDLGSGDGCNSAGSLYDSERGGPSDERHAASLYQRACDLQFMTGCFNWAGMLETGRGTEKDESLAYAVYRAVCDADASGCEAAARLQAEFPRLDDTSLAALPARDLQRVPSPVMQ